jgi:hypothetical protein
MSGGDCDYTTRPDIQQVFWMPGLSYQDCFRALLLNALAALPSRATQTCGLNANSIRYANRAVLSAVSSIAHWRIEPYGYRATLARIETRPSPNRKRVDSSAACEQRDNAEIG